MPKRKYISEEEAGDDTYLDVECPECEATITARFQRGRRSRRLRCPVCLNTVNVSPESQEKQMPLIQLRRARAD